MGQNVRDIFRGFSNLNLISLNVMAFHNWSGKGKILIIFRHAPAVASRSLGSRTLVLMMYIICRQWGEDVFMRPAAMKTLVYGPALNTCIVP